LEYRLIRRCVIWFFFKKNRVNDMSSVLVAKKKEGSISLACQGKPAYGPWKIGQVGWPGLSDPATPAFCFFFFFFKINYSFSYFKFMFKLVLLLFFVLFGKSLLNDNYFFSCAFKFEVFSDASIFFLSFVWMNFIFKSKKNIFSDNISNMCNLAWYFCSFYFILSI
jgi:hypothetical protein